MVEEKLVNFRINAEIYQKLKILAARENRSIKDILQEEIENYCKVHEEGNPQHTIDSFSENSDFWGFPSIAIDLEKKTGWLENKRTSETDLQKLYWHIQEWMTRLETKGFKF